MKRVRTSMWKKKFRGVVYATGLMQVQIGVSQVFNNFEHSIMQTLLSKAGRFRMKIFSHTAHSCLIQNPYITLKTFFITLNPLK